MDCLEAQAAISEALDGAAPDAEVLDAAKQHCRECADCASFVSALNVVKRAPLPEPPGDLADRVMVAVRSEFAAEQALAAAAAAALAAKAGAPAAAMALANRPSMRPRAWKRGSTGLRQFIPAADDHVRQ
jgi:hypothetical protein